VNETFRTGDLVFVEAEIRTREFLTDEDRKAGRKPRKVLELWADEAHLVEKRAEGEGDELLTDEEQAQAAPSQQQGDTGPSQQQGDTGGDAAGLPKFI